MGTFALQLAFMSVYVNKFYHDYLNEERLLKLMDSMLPKSCPIVICLRKEDLDHFKELDAAIETIDDLIKVDEYVWADVVKYLTENLFQIVEYLENMMNYLNQIGVQNLEKFIQMVYSNLFKYAKSGDTNFSDKIKFIIREEENMQIPISAICEIKIISANKPKTIETNPGTKKASKKAAAAKTIHEFDYYEKSPYLPFFSENNCKILCYSQNFERMIRHNILECVNKLFKIEDLDKEGFMNKLEDSYREKFITPYFEEMAANMGKDIITYDFDLTVEPAA